MIGQNAREPEEKKETKKNKRGKPLGKRSEKSRLLLRQGPPACREERFVFSAPRTVENTTYCGEKIIHEKPEQMHILNRYSKCEKGYKCDTGLQRPFVSRLFRIRQ
jgi:hypothetical protein